MKPSLLAPIAASILTSASFAPSTFAGEDIVPLERYEREERRVYREPVVEYRAQPRTVYVIIKERPVQHIVHAAPAVRYYRYESAPRVIAREACYGALPSRYPSSVYHRRIGARIRH